MSNCNYMISFSFKYKFLKFSESAFLKKVVSIFFACVCVCVFYSDGIPLSVDACNELCLPLAFNITICQSFNH